MADLACLVGSDIRCGPDIVDAYGGTLTQYVAGDGTPLEVIIVGRIIGIVQLDETTLVAIIGFPTPDSPRLRSLFSKQLKTLHQLMSCDATPFYRVCTRLLSIHNYHGPLQLVVSNQPWCQGSEDSSDSVIFVRITEETTKDLFDFSDPSNAQRYAGFQSEIPVVGDLADPLDADAIVSFAVDMFRVDMPIPSADGRNQNIYDRTYALNASTAARFIRRLA
ncbi:hypothetical protein B0H13DRAFT_1152942 [Mycena leptocephala]|nr:hypothetical protein B0H13DRAFT_1152942 [Mycena leptocephala]